MEHISGQLLVKKDKSTVEADEALKDKEVVAFYFSAHWCPPCRDFTPVLANFYKECIENDHSLEIIFVTWDESEEDFYNYMNEAHGDWLAVPFGSDIIKKLETQYDVDCIPRLVPIKKDGTVLSTDRLADVEEKGIEAYKGWTE